MHTTTDDRLSGSEFSWVEEQWSWDPLAENEELLIKPGDVLSFIVKAMESNPTTWKFLRREREGTIPNVRFDISEDEKMVGQCFDHAGIRLRIEGLNRITVLHELAHWIVGAREDHGPVFRTMLANLVARSLIEDDEDASTEYAYQLLRSYDAFRLPYDLESLDSEVLIPYAHKELLENIQRNLFFKLCEDLCVTDDEDSWINPDDVDIEQQIADIVNIFLVTQHDAPANTKPHEKIARESFMFDFYCSIPYEDSELMAV